MTSIDPVVEKAWYLVYCKPRQEQVAKINLERQSFTAYLPLVRQLRRRRGRRIAVIEPLFPRYLFIQLSMQTDNWAPIRSTLGVSSLVRFGTQAAVVPNDLICLLQSRDDPEGVQELPAPDYRPGDRVRIAEGVTQGYAGIFLAKSGKDRVLVLLDILDKQARVDVPRDYIESFPS